MQGFGRFGLVALVAGVVAASSAAGCASTRDPINRVQANAIPKSFFVGAKLNDASDDPIFYARTMVVDVPYGESGLPGGLVTNGINSASKIRWDVEENNLVGRIAFERIVGTDGKGTRTTAAVVDRTKPLAQNDGVVVYNFRIESQFDIRRSYNPTTGEENNVIEENTTDRPWYEREYVRVDFSQNLVTTAYDFDTLSMLNLFGAIKYTPMQFDVRNPNDANAPVYDVANGYLDVTNKVFVEPSTVALGGNLSVPACVLPTFFVGGSAPAANCNPNEITLRHSFKRWVDTDYQATNWDGARFETYGAFTSERQGYTPGYGLTDATWKRYIDRYNVWERSHVYADPEKLTGAVACKVDADCFYAGGIQGMSRCDELAQKCTLPYQARTAKPIVWHYSDGSAPEYFSATQEATDEWDTAMRIAVQVAKYAECQRYGNLPAEGTACNVTFPGVVDGNFADEEDAVYLVKEVNACRRAARVAKKADPVAECTSLADELGQTRGLAAPVVAVAKLPEMVLLCHSPVEIGDAPACGKVGTVARRGDLRYHLVSTIASPQTGSPWGIMTDANDPETGEHVAASINVWSERTDTVARSLVDIARYIGGELSTADVTDGTYVDQWVEATRQASGAALTPVLGQAEVDKRIAAAAGVSVDAFHRVQSAARARRPMKGSALPSQFLPIETALLADFDRVKATSASLTATSQWEPVYEARRNQLRGTPAEAAVVTGPMQQLARAAMGDLSGTTTTSNASAMASASVLQGLDPKLGRDLYRKLHQAIADRGGCMMEATEAVAPVGYAALADVLQAKFGKFNARDDAATQRTRADRMFDYLRRRFHASVVSHEMGHSFGERHNFVSSSDPWNYRPQYWALRTNGKQVTADCAKDGSAASDGRSCIGPRWLDKITDNEHGQLLEMFASSSTMEYPGEPTQDMLGLGVYDFGAARMFYGDAATVYGDARFTSTKAAGAIAQLHQNEFGGLLGFRYGSSSNPLHYTKLDATVGLIEACATVDTAKFKPPSWNEATDGVWSPLLDGHIVTDESGRPIRCTQPKVDYVQWDALKSSAAKTHTADPKNRVRVPHAFASDEWADLGNVAVYRNDNGADGYEQIAFWQAKQEVNHIFANYRRGRRDFSIWDAFQRSLTRYLEAMRDNAKSIGLFANIARDTVTQYYSEGDDPQAYVASILADNAAENTIASSMAFDHFAHVFARAQPGPHGPLGTEDPGNGTTIARSYDSAGFVNTGTLPALLSVPNGVTGGFGSISLGGRPIENALATNQGRDYNRDYVLNVGSYYEKAFAAYLFTESADNFISSNRDDFVDPRFRAVSLADVFPDGFRRWLANNLTDDEQIKGNLVVAQGGTGTSGAPLLDGNGFARLAQTSWWPTGGLEACIPKGDSLFCHDPFTAGTPTGAGGTIVDPQVGFEQQKFALLMTLVYLPENGRTNWLDMLRIYDVSSDGDPGFDNRIELHGPDGKIYVAQTFGTETLYGKTVQRGVGARMLEWATFLMSKGVVTQPVLRNGLQVGIEPKLDAAGHVQYLSGTTPVATCAQSAWCSRLQDYLALPKLMHELELQLGVNRFGGWLRGVY